MRDVLRHCCLAAAVVADVDVLSAITCISCTARLEYLATFAGATLHQVLRMSQPQFIYFVLAHCRLRIRGGQMYRSACAWGAPGRWFERRPWQGPPTRAPARPPSPSPQSAVRTQRWGAPVGPAPRPSGRTFCCCLWLGQGGALGHLPPAVGCCRWADSHVLEAAGGLAWSCMLQW